MLNWQFGMKRKTEIQNSFVCHEYPKILHIKTTVSKEENMSAHWIVPTWKASKGPQVSMEDVKSPLWIEIWPLQKNACTHESLGYQYEWQKLLEEERRIYAYDTAWNLRKWEGNK